MKQNILIVGSTSNLGKFFYSKLKKKNNLLGISRKKTNHKNFECKDLSKFQNCLKTFKMIKNRKSTINAIIICTGKSKKSFNPNIDEVFLDAYKSNLLTVANTIEAYQQVYKNKPVKIIVISSIVALKVLNAPIEYSISKAALNHYCQIKAKALSKFKIRINIISPGNILNKNNNWHLKLKKNKKKVENYIKKNVPLNSFCQPNQILSLCNFLINQEGNFFQGSNIVIDGGQIL